MNTTRRFGYRSDWYSIAAIVLITFVSFLPVLDADFVRWDDNVNIIGNYHFRGLGIAQLKWMWSTTLLGHYVPLSWMSLGLDYALWGMDPRGYHLTNLLFHCAAAVLLYFVALRLFRIALRDRDADTLRLPITAAVLVFAVHPLRVESVAWVTERRDLLSLVLMLASTMSYVRWGSGLGGRRSFASSLLFFAAALLSKASAVTLPLVFLVLNVYPLERLKWRESPATRRVFVELLPFFALSLAAGLLSVFVLKKPEQLPLSDKLAVSAYGLGFYVWKTFVPAGLSPLYPLPVRLDPFAGRFLWMYAIAAAVVIVGWITRRRWAAVSAILLCSALIVLPLLGIVQNGPQLAADRYTYHAAAAFSLLVAVALVRWPSGLALAGAALIVSILGALTWRQTGYWTDSNRLFARVIEVDSTSTLAHIALADLLHAEKRDAEALVHYERGVALKPDYAEGYNNIGVILGKQGRYDKAVEQYIKALHVRPNYAEARFNLGVALTQMGQLGEAIEQMKMALQLNPRLSGAQGYLAQVEELARKTRTSSARPR